MSWYKLSQNSEFPRIFVMGLEELAYKLFKNEIRSKDDEYDKENKFEGF